MTNIKTKSKVEEGKKYKTIVIDPPWKYEQGLSKSIYTRGSAEKVYPVMSNENILNLPIESISDKDCQLWLWTTNSHLPIAIECVKRWGFTYKTLATWVKSQFGLGYWLRGQTEHLILATKGKPRGKFKNTKHGATGNNYSTFLVYAKRTKHSQKPEGSFVMIEDLSEEPRIELFSRHERLGWDVWGNEVNSDIEL